MGYHAAPTYIRGGFVGVDVFFVISGYLITSVILHDRDAGSFSVLDFFGRRVRRLLPALAVVLMVAAALGWFYLLPHEFNALGKHILAGAGYFANFALRREAGYFDAAADEKPLLHLWSLAVEEQFYLVWPLLFLLFADRRALAAVIGLLIGASFAWALFTVGNNQAAAFYLPQYRIWELGAGSLLAVIGSRLPIARPRVADGLSLAGLFLIIGAAGVLQAGAGYPGYFALAPVGGAVATIAAGPQACVNRFLLSHRVAVFIGLISYPLYLWHWPLLSFAHILGVDNRPELIAALLLLAFVLAHATYLYVEQPIRRRPGALIPVGLMSATAVVGVMGALQHHGYVWSRLSAPMYRDISASTSDWGFPGDLVRDRSAVGLKVYRSGRGSNAVLFIGDSHAEQYWPRVARWLDNGARRPIAIATWGGCPPIPGMSAPGRQRECSTFTDAALRLAKHRDVATVVFVGAWLLYFDHPGYEVAGVGSTLSGAPGRGEALRRLAAVLSELKGAGKSVWLVAGSPVGLAPTAGIERSLVGRVPVPALDADRVKWSALQSALQAVAQRSGASFIDPLQWLCRNGVCPGRTVDGRPIYMDDSHLRASFVRDHAGFIDQVLEETVTGSLPAAPGHP